MAWIHGLVAGVFDLLTKAYMRSTKQEKAGVPAAVASGIVSSCLAQVISFPLETISRRLQVSRSVVKSALGCVQLSGRPVCKSRLQHKFGWCPPGCHASCGICKGVRWVLYIAVSSVSYKWAPVNTTHLLPWCV